MLCIVNGAVSTLTESIRELLIIKNEVVGRDKLNELIYCAHTASVFY